MREETRRRLERTLWRERAKKGAMAAVALGIIGAIFIFEDYDASVQNVRVEGTVLSIEPLNTTNTKLVENGLSVDVALQSGRRVRVMALKSSHPHVGDHVQITEHRHRTGRATHSWK